MRQIILITLLALTLSAEEPKPAPTIESQASEIASLKAQLASAQADLRLLAMQTDVASKVCEIPELMAAKLAAAEARKVAAPKAPAK